MSQKPLAGPGSHRAVSWARWVPIRHLGPKHLARMQAHLLALPEQDRYLRFGYLPTDEQISRYVHRLKWGDDVVLGVFNRRLRLIALAHLAFSTRPGALHQAEFGVSVAPSARGRGYGSRLFARAMVHARNHGITHLVVHALSENAPMLKIASRAGATIERYGNESQALLKLAPADFDSQVSEMLQDRAAVVDYHVKSRMHGWMGLRRLWRCCALWWGSKNGSRR